MNTTQSDEKKLVEWKSVFYSMKYSQGKDAKILAGLITNLSANIRSKQNAGVAA